jgi:Phage derived protein Gp49-like (DUF891)
MPWGTVELEPEVRDWLEGLSTAQFATAAFYVDLLAERGPLLGEPYTRQLDGKLRELRFHLERRAVRVTYWIATFAAQRPDEALGDRRPRCPGPGGIGGGPGRAAARPCPQAVQLSSLPLDEWHYMRNNEIVRIWFWPAP